MGTQDVDPEVVKADGDSLSTWQRDGDILRHVFHFKYANSEIGAYNVTKVSDSMNFRITQKNSITVPSILARWPSAQNRPMLRTAAKQNAAVDVCSTHVQIVFRQGGQMVKIAFDQILF